MAKKKTLPQKIAEKLQLMKVGDSFSKKEYIKEVWGDDDYFVDRTFSVAFANAKKLIPEKLFKTIDKQIIRIK